MLALPPVVWPSLLPLLPSLSLYLVIPKVCEWLEANDVYNDFIIENELDGEYSRYTLVHNGVIKAGP